MDEYSDPTAMGKAKETKKATAPKSTTSRFVSRKFLLTLLVFLSITGLLVFKHIDQAIFSNITLFLLGGYMTANVVQKGVTK